MLSCQLDGNVTLVARGNQIVPVSVDCGFRVYRMPGMSLVATMSQVRNNIVRVVLESGWVWDVSRPMHGGWDDLEFHEVGRIEW